MGAERLEDFKELVELELLVHFVGILETMKIWGSLFIQGYMCWSMDCNLRVFIVQILLNSQVHESIVV